MIEKFGKVLYDEPMRKYTTYKLSGNIKSIVYPNNIDNLIKLLKYLKTNKIKYKVVGNGSNLIFLSDYDGVIIKLDNFDKFEVKDNYVYVGAGYSLISLALKTANMGLSGLEFASGIPATLGGAIYMNAGAYTKEMADVVCEVMVLDEDFRIRRLSLKDLKFGYRSSILQKKNYICTEVVLKLNYGEKKKILELIKVRREKRLEMQPLNFPSAGSVFRNPMYDYAGRLIENANLKGTKIGGAMVSLKHANFIINNGGASGRDVYELIMLVKDEIKNKYGVDLIVEQEFVE